MRASIRILLLSLLGGICCLGVSGYAQAPASGARPVDRIVQSIDEHKIVVLSGNHHPLAVAAHDMGRVAPDLLMGRMILALSSDATQQTALDKLLKDQGDPRSTLYHQWLTPESFGKQFGASANDLEKIRLWLESNGFSVDEVAASQRLVMFSGTAAGIETTFHTEMHRYQIGAQQYIANATDPAIPSALAQSVTGVVTLHNFPRQALHMTAHTAPGIHRPGYTIGSQHFLTPADFATIYDLQPLYAAGVDGTGETIAVVARSNVHPSDITTFRAAFSLPANTPQILLTGADPGTYDQNEELEADLDMEWAGAIAPKATVVLVVSASTPSTDGVDLSAQYIVNHNLAAVVSTSFGSCEAMMGTTERAFYNGLWQQAAAEGITALVASGDSGAAGCDSASATTATSGKGVNGLCSSPYSMCVGGTQLNDTANPGLWWANGSTYSSALSYIPEKAWNESGLVGGSGLQASGGGASLYYSKPQWQQGVGVPPDGQRDVPDVSLAAAGHDGYIVYREALQLVVSGTSASTPAMAGVMALINAKTASRQGNANPTLYTLAAKQLAGGAAMFHDIVAGNNTVPGVTGYNSTPGYDLVTGLGSVDAAVLTNHWGDALLSGSPTFTVSLSAPSLAVLAGTSATVTVTTSATGGFSSPLTLSLGSLPTGLYSSFQPAVLPAPGSGTSILQVGAGSGVSAGAYPVMVTVAGGQAVETASLNLLVTQGPQLTLALSSPSVTLPQAGSGTVVLTTKLLNTTGIVSLAVAGLPSGVSAVFSPPSLLSGTGSSTLTLTSSSNAVPGTTSVTVTATSPSVVASASLAVVQMGPPSFALSTDSGSLGLYPGGSGSVLIRSAPINGFTGTVQLSASGAPAGATVSFASSSLSGSGSSTMNIALASAVALGNYQLQITGTSGSIFQTIPFTLSVVPQPAFTFSATNNLVYLVNSGSAFLTLTSSGNETFQSAVSYSISGLPSGVTAAFFPSVLPSPGSGSTSLSLNASSDAPPGIFDVTVVATAGSVIRSVLLRLNLNAQQSFQLTASPSALNISKGSVAPLTISAQSNGDGALLNFSLGQLPVGVAVASSTTQIGASHRDLQLQLSASQATLAGNYILNIQVSSKGSAQTIQVPLTIID